MVGEGEWWSGGGDAAGGAFSFFLLYLTNISVWFRIIWGEEVENGWEGEGG